MNTQPTTSSKTILITGVSRGIGKALAHKFLTEAVALTVIGGTIGVILGWLIAYGVTYFGILQASISTSSVLLAFGVSAAIGIVFGYYPARRAAGLNPIEALRYE